MKSKLTEREKAERICDWARQLVPRMKRVFDRVPLCENPDPDTGEWCQECVNTLVTYSHSIATVGVRRGLTLERTWELWQELTAFNQAKQEEQPWLM